MSARIGFIGVGRMGAAMAEQVAKAGLSLGVYDVDAKACQRMAALGATVAGSPKELAAQSDLISIVVLDDAQVRQVMSGADGVLDGARPGAVVAVHSTVHLSTLLEVAERARSREVEIIDAAVSGHVAGANKGELAVMLGGNADTIERFRTVFETYGGLVLRMGPLGSGMKTKLARNAIGYLQLLAAYEGMRLATASGIDLADLTRIVHYSEARSGLLNFYMSRPTVDPLDPARKDHEALLGVARTVVPTADKDLSAALALGDELDVDLPAVRLGRAWLRAVWGLEPPPGNPA